MNLKALATIAATVIATSAYAQTQGEQKCGAASCAKKQQQAACSKKDASCSKKDASCSKKEGACEKKDAACSKKEACSAKK